MTASMRYYAEFTDVADWFESKWRTGWQIFDRESVSPQGDVRAVAFCTSRRVAFKIRDALNSKSPEQQEVEQ